MRGLLAVIQRLDKSQTEVKAVVDGARSETGKDLVVGDEPNFTAPAPREGFSA